MLTDSPSDLFGYVQPLSPVPGVPKQVCDLFEELALEVWKRGYKRYSSDAILHRIRWHFHIEKGQREFKCNDHWTAPLARWFMDKHSELDGFFETRERVGSAGDVC